MQVELTDTALQNSHVSDTLDLHRSPDLKDVYDEFRLVLEPTVQQKYYVGPHQALIGGKRR